MINKRILSTLLALAILLSCVGWTPAQAHGTALIGEPDPVDPVATTAQPQEESRDKLLRSKPIARLYDEEGEDLNKIIYLNNDGTRTMHLYDYPVKYRDASGEIHDISLEIADGTTELNRFQSSANSIMTSFPSKASDGISLSSEGVSIKLFPNIPEAETNTIHMTGNAKRIDSKTVSYDYDAKTTIEYSLTYTGFKEDIVVSEYTGQTEYEFLLQTNGLALTQIDGSFYLTDESGKIKAAIGDVIVFTADEKNNTMGMMEAETLKENHSYLLTIVLDAQYLADPNTAYPIRIDPTIDINYDANGSGAIEDVTIYSQVTPDGASTSLFVGLRETRGISRILMRFPNLDLSGLNGATVVSAEVTLRDLICEGTYLPVYCYPFIGANWTESTASWSMTQDWGPELDSEVISYSNGVNLNPKHRYTFDITAAVQGWIDGTYSKAKGLIFKTSNEVETATTYEQRQFASYNRTNYRPTFTMYYVLPGSITAATNAVNEGGTLQLTAHMNGNVTWVSSDPTRATISSNGLVTAKKAGKVTVTATCDDYAPATFTLWVTLVDGVYYIKNQSGFCIGATSNPAEGEDIYTFTKATSGIAQSKLFWIIKYQDNGLYTIENSLGPDLWLSASSENVEISASTQTWKIYFDGTGYVLLNRGLNTCAMSWEQPGAYPGLRVLTGMLTTSSVFRWQFERANHVAIEFSYDHGQVDEFMNSQSTEEETCDKLDELIIDSFEIAANAYAVQCGIFIECLQTAPTYYLSDADLCPNSGINEDCQCVDSCLLRFSDDPELNNNAVGFTKLAHCKNLVRLRNNLIVGIPENTIRFTYTGHNGCYSNGTTCGKNSVGAIADYHHPIICSKNDPGNVFTIAHEIAHLYGIVHHERISEEQKCIMDYGNQDYFKETNAKWWCDNCMELLKANRNKY